MDPRFVFKAVPCLFVWVALLFCGMSVANAATSASANPSSPRAVNTPITLSCTTTLPTPEYRYRVGYKDADNVWHWTDLLGTAVYTTANTYIWTPQQAHTWTVAIWVRTIGHPNTYDEYASFYYTTTNSAPTANNDVYSTNEDTPLTVAASGVLTNDTDLQSQPLSATKLSDPAHGQVTLNSDGSFTYIPEANWVGADSFTYQANDSDLSSNTATVNITVTATPLFEATLTATPASPRHIYTPITLTAGRKGGTNPEFRFRVGYKDANEVWHWTDLLGYGAETTCVWTPTAAHMWTVVVWVREVGSPNTVDVYKSFYYTTLNDAPVAVADTYTMAEDGVLEVPGSDELPTVLANDYDAEGATLTATQVIGDGKGPFHGTVTLTANGGFTYTPAANWYGTDNFTYKVFDGALYSNEATVTINVMEVNDAPSFTKGMDQIHRGVCEAQSITNWATNITAGPANEASQVLNCTITENTNPSLFAVQPSLDLNGTLAYTPTPTAHGKSTLTVQLQDNGGTANGGQDTYVQTFSILFNDQPVAQNDTITILKDQPVTDIASASDLNGDTLSYSIVTNGSKGTFTFTDSSTGVYLYTPNSGEIGFDTIEYRVNDGFENSNTAIITITVSPFAITPRSETVIVGGSCAFSATGNEVVTWSVQETGGGSINQNGEYVASQVPGIYHVCATYNSNPPISISVPVTVVNVLEEKSVVIGPGGGTLSSDNYPDAISIYIPANTFTANTTVRLEVLSSIALPFNGSAETLGMPVRLHFEGGAFSPNAQIQFLSSATVPTGKILAMGYCVGGIWFSGENGYQWQQNKTSAPIQMQQSSTNGSSCSITVGPNWGDITIGGFTFPVVTSPPDAWMEVYNPTTGTFSLFNNLQTVRGHWEDNNRIAILVHGLWQNPDGLKDLADHLVKDATVCNRPAYDYVYAVHYKSSPGYYAMGCTDILPYGAPISGTASVFAELIEDCAGGHPFQVDVIAHSLGGAVSRSAIEMHGASAYVKNIITLSSPHQGHTLGSVLFGLLNGAPLLLQSYCALNKYPTWIPTAEVLDIQTDSDFMNALNAPSGVPCKYFSAIGTDSMSRTPFMTVTTATDVLKNSGPIAKVIPGIPVVPPSISVYDGEAVVDYLLGGGRGYHDGLVQTFSSGADLSPETSLGFYSQAFALNHDDIKDDTDVLAQIDRWLGSPWAERIYYQTINGTAVMGFNPNSPLITVATEISDPYYGFGFDIKPDGSKIVYSTTTDGLKCDGNIIVPTDTARSAIPRRPIFFQNFTDLFAYHVEPLWPNPWEIWISDTSGMSCGLIRTGNVTTQLVATTVDPTTKTPQIVYFENGSYYTANWNGSGSQFLHSADNCYDISFSPDGSKFAFWCNADGTTYIGLMNRDGTGTQLLCPGYHPAFSSDGKGLVYVQPYTSEICIISLDGSDCRTFLETCGEKPRWWKTLIPNNATPVASNVSTIVKEDCPTIISNTAVDPEGESLIYYILDEPQHGSVYYNSGTRALQYTPDTNYTGQDSFTFKVSDGINTSNAASVSVTVVPVNDAPIGVQDSYLAHHDTPLNVNSADGVLHNDTDNDSSQIKSYLLSEPANGTIVLNTDGSFTYTPNAGWAGHDSFTYKVNDGTSDSGVTTVHIYVL